MARIRSIHPGLWTDESFVSISPYARLLFIGIWNECDDQGAFEWKPIQLKMRLMPVDNVDVKMLLDELAAANLIKLYQVNGICYGAVRHFREWQRPKKPNQVHPMPDEFRTYAGSKNGSSEPEDDEDPSSSPPPQAQAPPVPPKLAPKLVHAASIPKKSEIPPQMEDGGWREGEEEKERPFASLTRSAVAEREFEAFWKIYPRKIGKGQARKAWGPAVRKAPALTILAAVDRATFPDNPKFIPHPATWLNGERWLDEAGDQFDPVLRAVGLTPEDMETHTAPELLQ